MKPNWTEEQLEALKSMLEAGCTFGEVAKAIEGKSRNACIGRARREGFISISRQTCRRHAKPTGPKLKRVPASPPPSAKIEPLMIPLMELHAQSCRFPMWGVEGGAPDYLYCGAPRTCGPYCNGHARVAFNFKRAAA